jgi:hypothetical protein
MILCKHFSLNFVRGRPNDGYAAGILHQVREDTGTAKTRQTADPLNLIHQ